MPAACVPAEQTSNPLIKGGHLLHLRAGENIKRSWMVKVNEEGEAAVIENSSEYPVGCALHDVKEGEILTIALPPCILWLPFEDGGVGESASVQKSSINQVPSVCIPSPPCFVIGVISKIYTHADLTMTCMLYFTRPIFKTS